MTFKFSSLCLSTLSMVAFAFIFCHIFAITDDKKLLNSFENVLNTIDLSLSNGDWQPIKDPNDPKVVEIAKFAVNSENIRSMDVQLRLESVLDGRFQVDYDGITYELKILAIDFDEENKYKTVVLVNSKDNEKKFISFSQIQT